MHFSDHQQIIAQKIRDANHHRAIPSEFEEALLNFQSDRRSEKRCAPFASVLKVFRKVFGRRGSAKAQPVAKPKLHERSFGFL